MVLGGRLHQIFNRAHTFYRARPVTHGSSCVLCVFILTSLTRSIGRLIDGDGYATTPQGYIQFQPINGTSFSFERCPLSAICCECKQRCDISLHFWVNVCMCAAIGAPCIEKFMQQIIIILIFRRKLILRGERNTLRKRQPEPAEQRHANVFKWRGCNTLAKPKTESVRMRQRISKAARYRLLPTKN